ncbi:SAC domain containing protein [Musa troglodytarum]|uniref:SAC domain containing protein n=1 Tax=Musa troglodytarum TaxID=320322 RepID=A0A9E7FCP8_9LILI|nr:SAC domain containing protein [Musa troglodytarum]
MAVQDGAEARIAGNPDASSSYLHKFRLYETRSKFYMIGRDKSRTLWRVLKIDRSDASELNIHEDATTYTESECSGLLKQIDEGNRSTGGLKFVTNCYGIVVHRKDKDYEATQLHFENLVKRYGNPIIILNLIKSEEKKPRESILRAEFANAIEFLNKDVPSENRLMFLHWDLHKHSRRKDNVDPWSSSNLDNNDNSNNDNNTDGDFIHGDGFQEDDMMEDSSQEDKTVRDGSQEDNMVNNVISEQRTAENEDSNCGIRLTKSIRFQKGVLRTNCIDCLDRTNVAQYAHGLAALGHQLHALGLIRIPRIDLDAPLADDLMSFYEKMGDTLALQYGGSAAHNKIFSERRGLWKAAVQSQEFFRTLQRYYSNAYMDAEKQAAINLLNSPLENLSTENVNGINAEATPPLSENGSGIKGKQTLEKGMTYDPLRNYDTLGEFSDSFIRWIEGIVTRKEKKKRGNFVAIICTNS